MTDNDPNPPGATPALPVQMPLPPVQQWQQIATFLIHKYAGREVVEITEADVKAFEAAYAPSLPIVFVDQREGKFRLSIITEKEATELTGQGLPHQTTGGAPMAPGSDALQ